MRRKKREKRGEVVGEKERCGVRVRNEGKWVGSRVLGTYIVELSGFL